MNTNDNKKYNSKNILGILSNKFKIEESVYYGSINFIDNLIDLNLLFNELGLNNKQLKIIELYYFQQYTQKEVALLLNISQQAVYEHLSKVKFKIENVIERWNSLDVY